MATTLHIPPFIATFIYAVGIVGLFWIDKDPDSQASRALWLPVMWLLINGSRPVSMWLGMSPNMANGDVYVEGSPIDRTVYLGLLIAGLIVVHRRMGRLSPLLRMNGPILWFFSYAALSALWSDFPLVTLKHWIKGMGDVVMVLIIVTERDLPGALKVIVRRVGFLLVPLSMLFCKYYPNLGRALSQSWTMAYTGVTTQKNGLGTICMVFGLGFLWRFRSIYNDSATSNRPRLLAAYGTVLGMTLWLLWISQSMTSISCLFMGGAVMIWATRPAVARRPLTMHVLVIVMAAVSVFALFFEPGGGLVGLLGRNTTLTGRTEVWKVVLQFAGNPLLGTGYESFWLGNRLQEIRGAFTNFNVNESHNGYLEIYVTLGWIGVILLGIIGLTGYRKLLASLPANAEVASLGLGWFVAGVIHNLTEAGFRMLSLSWIFFLLAIVSASLLASPAYLEARATDTTGNVGKDDPPSEPAFDIPVFGEGWNS